MEMMVKRKQKTGISFLLSLIIHVAIIALIILSIGYFAHSEQQGEMNTTPSKTVQAVAVNQQQVEAQVQQIQAAEKAKQDAQVAWQQHLQALANKAQNQREAEQQKVQQLQQQQKALEVKTKQQKIAVEQQLARLDQLKAAASKKLNQLQTQQQKLEEQNSDISMRLSATKQALKEEQSAAAKQRLEQELADEQAQQQALARQQMLNQLARYKTLILNAIGKQWIIPQGVDRSLSCQLLIKLAADGTVLNVQLLRSSGNAILDQSAVTAVMKASPLPVPQNPLLMQQFRELQLTVKPEGLLDQ